MSVELDVISAALAKTYGVREQWCDEYYWQLIDTNVITRTDMDKHKYAQFCRTESQLAVHEYGVYLDILRKYAGNTSVHNLNVIHSIYNFNKYDVVSIFEILGRHNPKRRCLCLYGPSNCGKSLLANCLLYPWAPGYIQRDGGTNVHWLEHIYRKSFILWEEPSIHMTNLEDTKLLLGGERIAINRKNKPIIERINDPAVIITTNRQIWQYDPNALQNRMKIFKLNQTVNDITSKYIKPQDIISYLIAVHDGRLNSTGCIV